MGLSCAICGRTSSVGNQITRSGSPKYKGGIGLHTGGISKRRFYPNIQKIKIVLDGKVGRVNVCTRCLKAGKVKRAPARPNQVKRSADKAEARRLALVTAEAARAAAVAAAEKERLENEAAQAEAEAAAEAAAEARIQARAQREKGRRGAPIPSEQYDEAAPARPVEPKAGKKAEKKDEKGQ